MSTLMAYPPISDRVGSSSTLSQAPMVSHAYGAVFLMYIDEASDGGFRRWDAWPNGNELAVANLADCNAPANGFILPWCLTYNHNGIAASNEVGGVSIMTQRNFTRLGQVPTNHGDAFSVPQHMVSISLNGDDVLITTTVGSTHAIQATSFSESTNKVIFSMTETHGVLGAYPDGSGDFFYAMGTPDTTSDPLTLYKGVGLSVTASGTISPSQIDPAWTVVDFGRGLIIDQTDNNPMALFENETDVGVQTYYLVKLDGDTGAIIWTSALPGAQNWDFWNMFQTLVKNQTIYYLTTTHQVATISTIDGTFTLSDCSNAALAVSSPTQVSEDVVGSVYFKGLWTEDNTHPNYVGTYMGAEGNHTIVNYVMRFFPGANAPVVPAPALMATSRQRAWTFTLDGHKFYVLDLGDQGTLLYDSTTTSWSQFVTTGYNNWNFRNGTMWDQRIIGGDTDIPQVWEMAPSYMQDNGALDITHVSTGALIKRTRTYTSCAAVRLAVSVGDLDDSLGGATVLLEFSDDQGQSWTAMDTKVLTEDDYGAELAWQGLGSFAAPGRIFRITDVGGFLRIDGCDAELDDFDEDGNAQARDDGQ